MWPRMYTFHQLGDAHANVHWSCCCCCFPTPAHRGGAAFTVRRAYGGAAEVHSVDMQERNQLAALGDAVLSLEPPMAAYHRKHRAYKFQVAVDVMFHKAVGPAVVTQPPVTLRCDMAAVYPDESPQLEETSARLL